MLSSIASAYPPLGSLARGPIPQGDVPDIPANLAIELYQDKADFSWDSVAGATGYKLYRRVYETGGYVEIDDVATTTATDTHTASDIRYQYVVSAYNGAGESGQSSAVDGWSPVFYDTMSGTDTDITGRTPDTINDGSTYGSPLPVAGAGVATSYLDVSGGVAQRGGNNVSSNRIDASITGDHEVEVYGTLGPSTSSADESLCGSLRVHPSNDTGYGFQLFHNTLRLRRYDGGSQSTLASSSQATGYWASGNYKAILSIVGDDITVTITEIGGSRTDTVTASDSTYSDEFVAVGVRDDPDNNNTFIDSFGARRL